MERILKSVCTANSMIRHHIGSAEKAFQNGLKTKIAPIFAIIFVCLALGQPRNRTQAQRRNYGAYLARSNNRNDLVSYHRLHLLLCLIVCLTHEPPGLE